MRESANATCGDTGGTVTTTTFDVAHGVVVGAVPTGGVGGDTFVDKTQLMPFRTAVRELNMDVKSDR